MRVMLSENIPSLEIQARELTSQAAAITIYSDEEYEAAAVRVLALNDLKKEIKETFDPVVAATNRAHKDAIKARSKHLNQVEKAIGAIKDMMSAYHESLQEMAEEDADAGALLVAAPPPKVAGVSTRNTWSGRVVDQEALVAFVAQDFTKWGKLLKVDQVALNKFARSLNEGLSAVLPGVEAVCKRGVAVRS